MRCTVFDIGSSFGMLTVIGHANTRQSPSGQKKRYVKVKCECGVEKEVRASHLRQGITFTCGCAKPRKKTHFKSKTRLYDTWRSMKQRCYYKNNKSYRYYGGKGVTVCEDWLNSFQNFYDWAMANGYTDELTIDRIDNALVYSPENCEWVTLKENIRRRDEVRRKANLCI